MEILNIWTSLKLQRSTTLFTFNSNVEHPQSTHHPKSQHPLRSPKEEGNHVHNCRSYLATLYIYISTMEVIVGVILGILCSLMFLVGCALVWLDAFFYSWECRMRRGRGRREICVWCYDGGEWGLVSWVRMEVPTLAVDKLKLRLNVFVRKNPFQEYSEKQPCLSSKSLLLATDHTSVRSCGMCLVYLSCSVQHAK